MYSIIMAVGDFSTETSIARDYFSCLGQKWVKDAALALMNFLHGYKDTQSILNRNEEDKPMSLFEELHDSTERLREH